MGRRVTYTPMVRFTDSTTVAVKEQEAARLRFAGMSTAQLRELEGSPMSKAEGIEFMKAGATRKLLDATGEARLKELLTENGPAGKGKGLPSGPVGMDGKPIPESEKMKGWQRWAAANADSLTPIQRGILSGSIPHGSIKTRADWKRIHAEVQGAK